jgi:long-chain-fatty-acid--[acyl-carrier-protein] ligase
MLDLLRSMFWALVRMMLSLRYRVRLHGREQLRRLRGPVLILPNHPAYIDPPLVLGSFWPRLRPRPVIYEGFFHKPGYFRTPFSAPLVKFLDALLVPDRDQPSARSRAQARETVGQVIAGLRRGEQFIMWPAGHIQRDGMERLGAASALTDILEAVPEATVVLVRTRGLWGSRFSYAPTGTRPAIMGRVWAGTARLLSSLVWFMPRRRVDITVEVLDRSKLPSRERLAVNRWFEDWYNLDGAEKPTFVPDHHLFGSRTHAFPVAGPSGATADMSSVKRETRDEVASLLEDRLQRPLSAEELQPATRLDQLGLDSLETMAVVIEIEKRFGCASTLPPLTVGDLWLLAEGQVEQQPSQPVPPAWHEHAHPPLPPLRRGDEGGVRIEGETLAQAFVHRALAQPHAVAAADDQAGVLTYERLLVGALVLARRFARLPGRHVGLMLPASVTCDLAFLGLQLAGKVPVMLNWTTGPANLHHAARAAELSHVITSSQFLDRVEVEVRGVQLVLLEDLRKRIGRLERLRTLMRVRLWPCRIRRHVPAVDPGQPAVILFTSGSEKAPKAVPLTHRNLLHNQRACLEALKLTGGDTLLGFLPSFHSFGLSVTSLLPLLAGIRVVHHPDPTAAGALAGKIAAYRPTMLAGTPTFVRAILTRARPEQLQSLRLIYVGAEKCPLALWDLCRQVVPGACLLEGYGATECAPVIAANRPEANQPGSVGFPLPGVEVRVVEPNTGETLPPGQVGEVWVHGPNVFPGYLHLPPEQQPFRELDGRQWYVTGDLAETDARGALILRGRKSRFLKAGGEMISLPALEEAFQRRYPGHPPYAPPSQGGDGVGPRVAIEGIETPDGPRIVLFTTEAITLRQANAVLVEAGFHGIMRLNEVRRVTAIPLLGMGKIDHKALRAQITADEVNSPVREFVGDEVCVAPRG